MMVVMIKDTLGDWHLHTTRPSDEKKTCALRADRLTRQRVEDIDSAPWPSCKLGYLLVAVQYARPVKRQNQGIDT